MLAVPPEQFNAVIEQLAIEWNTYHTSYEVYFACGPDSSALQRDGSRAETFSLQEDGMLRCPAGANLWLSEVRA